MNIPAAGSIDEALKTLLAQGALRAPIVLLAALAYLAVSNHCALAAFAGSTRMPSVHNCHGMESGDVPAKQKHGGDVECCKVLRATLAKPATFDASNASPFALQRWFAEPMSFLPRTRSTPPLELDTGPPFSESFAETVLQRSILAHAPPALA